MKLRQLFAAALAAVFVVGLTGAVPAHSAAAFTTTLTGQVTFQGAPLDGVRVVLSKKKGGPGYAAQTDTDGRYAFDAVPLAADGTGVAWSLRAEVDQDANPLPVFTTYNGDTSRKQDAKKFVVPPGGATMDVALVASGTVTGKVVDADGVPVRNTSVFLYYDVGDGWAMGDTDAQGTYVLHGLDSGDVTISASKGRRSGTVTVALARGESVSAADIVLQPGPRDGAYKAKVKNLKKGEPIYLFNTETGYVSSIPGTKAARGDFTLKYWAAEGTYRLVAAGTNKASKKFTVHANKTAKVGTFKVPKKRTKVRGTLKRPNGKPFKGSALVRVYDSYDTPAGLAWTDKKGRFSVGGLVKGRYAFRVEYLAKHDGSRTVRFAATKGKNAKKNIKLRKAYKVTGQVTDGSSPVRGMRVRLVVHSEVGCGSYPDSDSATGCVDSISTKTDKNGRFSFTQVPGGRQVFELWDSELGGYRPTAVTTKVKKGTALQVTVTR